MSDVLTVLFDELRAAQPTDEALFMQWLESISQVILTYPTELRRMAATILVANDICVATGVPLDLCCSLVARTVDECKAVSQ